MNTSVTLYLLRHGETAWNRDGNRYAGRTDVPLSDRGREQARAVAVALRTVSFTTAFCSPLQRSRETAEIVAQPHNLAVVTDPRLIEIDFGSWEGLTRAEIQTHDQTAWTAWRADPEIAAAGSRGETGRTVADRFTAFTRDLVTNRPGETVLAVGHNTLSRLFLADALGMPLRNYPRLVQENAGLTIVEMTNRELIVHRMNVGCGGL